MKALTFFKSGVGLIYTTILFWLLYFVFIWVSRYILLLNWTGAILFWIIGLPIAIGLFQAISTVAAIPAVYLMKGAKWIGWILVLPCIYFMFSWGYFLWNVASAIGGLLVWLLSISWFLETAWLFVAYLMVAIGSCYETDIKR